MCRPPHWTELLFNLGSHRRQTVDRSKIAVRLDMLRFGSAFHRLAAVATSSRWLRQVGGYVKLVTTRKPLTLPSATVHLES
jgi:hypothetical protein